MQTNQPEPNGGIVAATVAAGAGCAALGGLTIASAASTEVADLLLLTMLLLAIGLAGTFPPVYQLFE